MENYIELQNITKHYNDQKIILDDLSLSMKQGEILSVVGPSGCGKTTLLRCMAGLERHEGIMRMNGTDLSDRSDNRGIVLMFQDSLLFPHMNVLENVTYGLKMKKIAKRERIRSAREMLAKVDMSDHEKKFPYELSGGQQQRVALARALVTKPDLLLLDEPFSNLDQSLRYELRQYVRNVLVEEGVTALFITHDKEEASFMGDRLAVMGMGRIQQVGHPEVLSLHPCNPFVAGFFSEGLVLEEGFIPTQKLTLIPSDAPSTNLQMEGEVVNESLEYGQKIYHIRVPQLEQTITIPSSKKHDINKGSSVVLKYTKNSIHHFDEVRKRKKGGEGENEIVAYS
ncbi:ABC transporter ATP-binding protein [Pseudalkalibacillus sp. Hm43]|uniref:ABC transporter ATP-binding protein n=1 Tax=Pseudalkalibacillus sp. Hm43 TaxID=3450742 RepID=UPI003F434685